jgi:NDP-sugar pyrophosphorylase family protein
MNISAVILAGGAGTRIEEQARGRPKALIEVNGRPFLFWKITELCDAGLRGLTISTGFRGEQIYQFVAETDFGIPIALVPDGQTFLGTLGALRRVATLHATSHLLVTYGDNLLDFNLEGLLSLQLARDESAMVVTQHCGPSDNFNSRITSEGRLAKYSKEPGDRWEMNAVEYGYTLLSREALLSPRYHNRPDMVSFFAQEVALDKVRCVLTDAAYSEIGTPVGLRQTEDLLRSRAQFPR